MTSATGSTAPESAAIGIVGATGLVGRHLLRAGEARGGRVVACSRREPRHLAPCAQGTTWCRPGSATPIGEPVPQWIATCPLWAVPEHLPWLESLGIQSLVALSSTSVDTKPRSPDATERAVAMRLAHAEGAVREWARRHQVALCILRPTMIYDGMNDANVAAIAAFIRRRGFVPLAGPARGLRQPVHAADVASACLAALARSPVPEAIYTLSGPNPLPFRDLVTEVFLACGRRPRIVHLPRWFVTALGPLARLMGRRGSLAGIAARMNEDLVFDHHAATRDLGFTPRPFSASTLFAETAA